MVSIQLSKVAFWMHHNHFGQAIWHWTKWYSFNGTCKKSSPLTLEFLYMGKCKRSSSIVEKKGRSWACRQVSDVHLWCFWFLFKYWYSILHKMQRFFLGKKRVKISYSWVRELLRSIGSHAGFGDFNAKV